MEKYKIMAEAGSSAVDVWRQASSDGLSVPERFRLVRSLFNLDLAQAKEVSLQAKYPDEKRTEFEDAIRREIRTALDDQAD